jgi:hypothetical protein
MIKNKLLRNKTLYDWWRGIDCEMAVCFENGKVSLFYAGCVPMVCYSGPNFTYDVYEEAKEGLYFLANEEGGSAMIVSKKGEWRREGNWEGLDLHTGKRIT